MLGTVILAAALIAGTGTLLYVGLNQDWDEDRSGDGNRHSLTEMPGCGASRPALLEGTEGQISSPTSMPSPNYRNNTLCQWRITVPQGKRAHLHMEMFSLEAGMLCLHDHLEVYDGADNSSTKLGRYCGNNIPEDITATSNVIFIQFNSDSSERDSRFKITYSATDAGEPACGIPEISPDISPRNLGIVNGKEARPHSWPWQISLRLRGKHWCGGSILSKRYIITAAHCVEGSLREYSIVAGKHNRNITENTEQVITVAAITIHENYNSRPYDNDIAILRLDEDIRYTPQVKPICLQQGDAATGKLCTTTGWGETQNTGDSTVLRQVHVPIVDRAVCSSPSWNGNSITDSMICAGYPQGGKDSCLGDSGGPLVSSENGVFRLHGVTSWGKGCALPKKPGVYVRVARFVDWVDAKTSGAFQLAPP